jgi:hypothetical protein
LLTAVHQASSGPEIVRIIVVGPLICPSKDLDGLGAMAVFDVPQGLTLEGGHFSGLFYERQDSEHSRDDRQEREHRGGDGCGLGGYKIRHP